MNFYTYDPAFVDNNPHPPPPPPSSDGERPWWRHTCTACGQQEGFHNDWDFVVCDDCMPGLRDVLNQAFEEYCAQRREETLP